MDKSEYFWNEKAMYDEALAKHGESPKALHYLDYRSMAVRHQQLVADLALDGKTILDVGCGMGDLLPFLYAKTANFNYLGVDINEGFIEIAKKRYDGHRFKVVDPFKEKVSGRFDIVISSGVMNANTPQWLKRRQQMIEKLFKLSRETVAFNMAGAFKQVPNDQKIAYAKTSDILNFCLTLTPRVILRSHYSSIDFTILMFK
jgi:SAM-dependent methyltransferase